MFYCEKVYGFIDIVCEVVFTNKIIVVGVEKEICRKKVFEFIFYEQG